MRKRVKRTVRRVAKSKSRLRRRSTAKAHVRRRSAAKARPRRRSVAKAKSRQRAAHARLRRTPKPAAKKARALKGHVDLLGLGNVVQLLFMNKCEGTLEVAKGSEKQAIHFGPGGLRLVSSSVPRV